MLKAVVFDFDGVILESVDIKTRAFKELFKNYPEHLERIVNLHLYNAGMSLFDKFEIICRDYLGQHPDEGELMLLGEAFSRLVYREVLRCPFVPGAYQFLEKRSRQYEMFIASGAPQDEIRDIVKHRELDGLFEGVYGSPRKKHEILGGILVENQFRPMEVVFIGDGLSDSRSAREVCVPFIGRVPKGDSSLFQGEELIATIEDLYELDQQWTFVLKRLSSQ